MLDTELIASPCNTSYLDTKNAFTKDHTNAMTRQLTTLLLSASIVVLAGSFIYLAITLNHLSQQAPGLISELKTLNASVPPVVKEAKQFREEIPEYIEQFNTLMANSRESGKQAGEGAVTGIVTGVFKAPFSLISALAGSFGGSVKFSAEEREVMAVAMSNLLATNQPGVNYPFAYPASGMTGVLELTTVNSLEDKNLYEVRIQILRNNVPLIEKDFILEQDSRGELKLVKRTNSTPKP